MNNVDGPNEDGMKAIGGNLWRVSSKRCGVRRMHLPLGPIFGHIESTQQLRRKNRAEDNALRGGGAVLIHDVSCLQATNVEGSITVGCFETLHKKVLTRTPLGQKR